MSAAALVRLQVVVEGVVLCVYQVHVPLAAYSSEDDGATRPVILIKEKYKDQEKINLHLSVAYEGAASPDRHRAQTVLEGEIPELPPDKPHPLPLGDTQ